MDPVINDNQFQQDDAALLADAAEVQKEIQEAKQDEKDYMDRLKKLSSDPGLALLQLFFILYASPSDDTAGGGIQNKIGLTGARLKLNSDLTKTNNDLSNMINSNNDNPKSLSVFANDASKLLGQLSGDPSRPGYDPNLDPNAANPSIDPQTEGSVFSQLDQIRKLFKIPDPIYPGDNPGSSDTYYFDPNDKSKIQSFKEYQDLLKGKGDEKDATDAAKKLTDSFSTNTQTTQTTSAVLNNDMKTFSPLLQTIQQFDTSLATMITTVRKASINHIASGA